MKKQLAILFAGEAAKATLVDGSSVDVFVRAVPQRYLHHIISACEFKPLMVELATYTKIDPTAPAADLVEPADVAFPDVLPPSGYLPVPKGWADNLADESLVALYDIAVRLSFQRAADWAKGQIAAKKLVAPLHQAAMDQVQPLVDRVLAPLLRRLDALSNSTPKSPPSPDGSEKTS